jgi:sialate O-acetylesterase
MKLTRLTLALAAVISTFNFSAHAELRLPAIFGDNMVLQRDKPVSIWGWSDQDVEVTVKFAGQTNSTRSDASGRWFVKLRKLKASADPQSLIVESSQTKIFTNVLIGEVWLASGQSNMEKPIGNQPGQKPTFNAEEELAAADYPNIRIFKIGRTLAATPQADLTKFDGWQACSSNALNSISFSAAAYFFGREIHTNLDVPVGLIESSWGGTRIEPWTPPVGFEKVPALAHFAKEVISTNKIANTRPMAIYNAMIAPIVGFGMRGALWYQGEANVTGTNIDDNYYANYDSKMAALIGGWRELWGEGDFPFYFVEIAPFEYYGKIHRVKSSESLPEFWNIQSKAARHIKNTGMVVTTDLVDDIDDIHPRDKSSVGHRLALLARDKTYGEDVTSFGPVLRSVDFSDNKAILKFDNTDGWLRSNDGKALTWFTIAGKDGKFFPAFGQVIGDTVILTAAKVREPKTVRFAWDETAQPNLCNGAGLPAEAFRSDKLIK